MKKIAYILIVAISLCACSAQQRINRIVSNHPELATVVKDSVVMDTTLVIEKRESLVKVPLIFHDTITYTDTNMVIQIVQRDSINYIHVEVPADTVFVEKTLEIEKQIIKAEINEKKGFLKSVKNLLKTAFVILLLLLLMLLILKILTLKYDEN